MIYKGRFNQIKRGKISNSDLALLANNLLKKDCVNFDKDNVGKGFPAGLSESILKYIPEDKNTSILIMNGVTLELYNILKENGYNNVTLAFGNWNKQKQNYIDDSKETFAIMKEYIRNNFEDKVEIIRLQEIFTMGKKFDLVISNPPYGNGLGTAITKAIVDNVEFDTFVNLMPVSKYKSDLHKSVLNIESVADCFDDAAVGDSLTIAVLRKNANVFESYQELEFMKMDPQYVEFYKLNSSKTSSFIYKGLTSVSNPALIGEANSFYMTQRTVQNGTHDPKGRGASDIDFNLKGIYNTLPWSNTFNAYNGRFLVFKSILEKTNICRFWYYNPLMNKLLKGLNKSDGDPRLAIPNIDWSIERDYEHLTLEDIMNILREENPDVA